MQIVLTQGKAATIDDDCFDLVKGYKWNALRGRNGKYWYAQAWSKKDGKRVRVLMHRVVLGVDSPEVEVDHIDHDGLNNRIANLRQSTNQQNQWNSLPRDGLSQYKGVSWNKTTQKWYAYYSHDGKDHYLGQFTSEVEAARAYDAAASSAFGEFARLNGV